VQPRIDYGAAAPAARDAVIAIEKYVRSCGLERSLLELVRLRASQINGCAYCIDMHTKDARAEGETEQRLYALSAWHETPFYSDRERAALAWTEAVTLVNRDHVPDDVYRETRRHFSEKEIVDLTLAVIAINSWNRLAISFRAVPGSYRRERPAGDVRREGAPAPRAAG
jgi:AhpD family alkylhydroperoxidase